MEVFPSIEDLRSWADRLEEVQERLAPYFERAEPRQRAMAYIRGEVKYHRAKKWMAVSGSGGRSDAGWDAAAAQHSALGCRSGT
jgi:L-fucose mutarotase/ribose pyranase (RbsD/FucU family)